MEKRIGMPLHTTSDAIAALFNHIDGPEKSWCIIEYIKHPNLSSHDMIKAIHAGHIIDKDYNN